MSDHSTSTMALTGLLVITSPLVNLSSQVGRILQAARQHVHKTLYVQLLPGQKNLTAQGGNRSPLSGSSLSQYSVIVSGLYSKASVVCNHLDVKVLLGAFKQPGVASTHSTRHKVDVVIFDQGYNHGEMKAYVENSVVSKTDHCRILTLDFDVMAQKQEGASESEVDDGNNSPESRITDKLYKCVALGGTFDRLHNGHKILLTEGVLRSSEELVVGVTDGPMILGKKLYELIEPCLDRMQHVRDFLEDVDPQLNYRVVPITDPFGPTRDDPDIEMLVVSEETYRGGLKVNEVRKAGSLLPLNLHQIPLLKDKFRTSTEEEEKISSSSLRMRLLGSRWRVPEEKPHLAKIPYVIGLTGGIASGKTFIGKKMEALGAAVIDCDKLGQQAYLKGSSCYEKVVAEFGVDILDADGEIDRKALGRRAFGAKEKLVALNQIVWPEIAAGVQDQIDRLREQGKLVVVLDAAVLLEAGWHKICHEVWVTIIPRKEAIQRIQRRNALSEQEAEARVDAQISNEERIAQAHIVFSSFWYPEHTVQQVEKAWQELRAVLAKYNCSL